MRCLLSSFSRLSNASDNASGSRVCRDLTTIPSIRVGVCVRILCSNFVHNGLLSFPSSFPFPLPCAPTAALVDTVNQSKALSKWPPFDSYFCNLRVPFDKKEAKWSFGFRILEEFLLRVQLRL